MESCFHDGGYLGFPSEDEDIRRLLKMIDTDISPSFCAGVASPCLLQCFDAEESRVVAPTDPSKVRNNSGFNHPSSLVEPTTTVQLVEHLLL